MEQSTYDRLVAAIAQAVTDEFDQMVEDGVSHDEIEAARNEFCWEAYEEENDK